MTKRKRLSKTARAKVFTDHNGICEFCDQPIHVGQAWDVSHSTPLELGGADDASNWRPAHRTCHRQHTATEDQPRIAKAKAQAAVYIGAKVPKQQIRSRGFPTRPRVAKPALPPRPLYSEPTP